MTPKTEIGDTIPAAALAPITARVRRSLRWTLQLGLPALLVWAVLHELRLLDVQDVHTIVAGADLRLLAIGIAITGAALAIMGLYDAFAFNVPAGTLSFGRRWMLGAVLFGWTNFLSIGPVGGPAIRLLIYRKAGLNAAEVARGIVGYTVAGAIGLVAWLLALFAPLPPVMDGLFVRAVLALGTGTVLAAIAGRSYERWSPDAGDLPPLPWKRLVGVAIAEWGLTGAAFVAIARSVGVGLDVVDGARLVLVGQLAGMISMVPGGLGSADAVWFKGFSLAGVSHAAAAGAVVTFRACFYLGPWIASLVVLYVVATRSSARLRGLQRVAVAGAVLVNAVLLLLSSALPAIDARLSYIERFLPVVAIDASHLVATLAAGLMLFLVRGLLRGYRAAYLATLGLLAASVVAHPLKGADFEEAGIALLLAAMLLSSRRAFVRQGRVPVGWEPALAAAVSAMTLYTVIGVAGLDTLALLRGPWVILAGHDDVARFVRGALVLSIAALVILVRQAMRPKSSWLTSNEGEIQRAEALVRAEGNSAEGLLIGGGDKMAWFLVDDSCEDVAVALLQRTGDRLVVFGEPVLKGGVKPAHVIEGLQEAAEDWGVSLGFASVGTAWMSHLHNFGYHFMKIGEDAEVSLVDFSMQGGKMAGFRRTLRDMEAVGARFEFKQAPHDAALIDELRTVSDTWLRAKGTQELQCSACYFSDRYLQAGPVALVRDASGAVVAFLNVLATRPGGPVTIDLMRHIPGRVEGAMNFLLIRTIETMAAQGYISFGLGAAPLSSVGVERGSRWAERALYAYSQRAEHLYNYRGLRHFKTKFHPQWSPRYNAFLMPWDGPASLLAVARLVKGRDRLARARIAAARIAVP